MLEDVAQRARLSARWRAQQRLQMTDQGVELDGERLPAQGFQMDTHG